MSVQAWGWGIFLCELPSKKFPLILKDGVAYIQAGGGIVADSVPETEYLETLHKAQAVLLAIQEAEAAD